MLKLKNVSKVYHLPEQALCVLREIDLEVAAGSSLAIVGPSGSGKTTLLGICAGLDVPSTGEVILNGHNLTDLNEEQRAQMRARNVGFVFQNFQLLPTLSALENVCVPLELLRAKDVRKRALELLDRVGLGDRAQHYPVQLSGGEQQRIALARALAANPAILFADEPTGNLDGDTSAQIEELLFTIHRESANTLIMVTHDADLASRADARIRLRSGAMVAA